MTATTRQPRKKKTHKVDLTIPIDKTKITTQEGDCFGKEWDPETKECAMCADSEVCGIIFDDQVRSTISKKESESKYLDQVDANLDVQKIKNIVKYTCDCNEPTTVEELFEYCKYKTGLKSDEAVIDIMKRLIKSTPELYTKDGIVLCQAN